MEFAYGQWGAAAGTSFGAFGRVEPGVGADLTRVVATRDGWDLTAREGRRAHGIPMVGGHPRPRAHRPAAPWTIGMPCAPGDAGTDRRTGRRRLNAAAGGTLAASGSSGPRKEGSHPPRPVRSSRRPMSPIRLARLGERRARLLDELTDFLGSQRPLGGLRLAPGGRSPDPATARRRGLLVGEIVLHLPRHRAPWVGGDSPDEISQSSRVPRSMTVAVASYGQRSTNAFQVGNRHCGTRRPSGSTLRAALDNRVGQRRTVVHDRAPLLPPGNQALVCRQLGRHSGVAWVGFG